MTKAAAIISAHTGMLVGEFSDLENYIEDLLGRPVGKQELARQEISDQIKLLSKSDFIKAVKAISNVEIRTRK